MFNLNTQFGLLGTGFVCDIIRHQDYWRCDISVIHQVDAPKQRPDEIMLHCRIEDKALLQLFALLEGDLHLGHVIVLQFVAEYLNFDSAHFDQEKSYQNHLLHFNVRLAMVEACLINGERFDFDKMRVIKKAA